MQAYAPDRAKECLVGRTMSGVIMFALLATGVLAASSAGAQEEGPPPGVAVDGAVQVTANPDPARGHLAPAIAVNPENDEVLAIAEGDVIGGDCAVHVSTDRGLSWHEAAVPDVPERWRRCAYQNIGRVVDVTFGPDGVLYYAFNGYDADTREGRVYLARSEDLGDSWDLTELPRIERDLEEGELGRDALPSVAVDPNDPNRVFVGWTTNWAAWTVRPLFAEEGLEYYWDVTMRPYVAASDDGGQTFGEPVHAADDLWLTEDVEGMKSPPELLVGTEGEVYAFFGESVRLGEGGTREEPGDETLPGSLHVAISEDGGETYEGVTVYTEPPPTRSSAFLWSPRADIDRGNGNLYVVWEQLSNAGQPVAILLSRSTDGGQTWTEAIEVNDEVPDREWTYMELFPNLSVAPNGRVDVAWYDPRNDPTYEPDEDDGASNAFHDVYYAYSDDEGATWSPNLRITDRSIDRRIGSWATGDVQGPLGITSTDGAAYIAWDDTRNGTEETQSQDIYATRARHQGADVFFAAGARGAPDERLFGGAMGAGVALLLGGALLLGSARVMRSRDAA